MAHYGNLGSQSSSNQSLSKDANDIRGKTVYGPGDEKIGKVDDVIFDHHTMEIHYLIVDTGGLGQDLKFMIAREDVSADPKHKDDFVVDATKQQIESSPRYNEKSLSSKDEWKKYEEEFKKYWDETPVMHRRGCDRLITPPEEPSQASAREAASAASREEGIPASELFPERISDKFSDTRPGAHKVTLRPRSVLGGGSRCRDCPAQAALGRFRSVLASQPRHNPGQLPAMSSERAQKSAR